MRGVRLIIAVSRQSTRVGYLMPAGGQDSDALVVVWLGFFSSCQEPLIHSAQHNLTIRLAVHQFPRRRIGSARLGSRVSNCLFFFAAILRQESPRLFGIIVIISFFLPMPLIWLTLHLPFPPLALFVMQLRYAVHISNKKIAIQIGQILRPHNLSSNP